MMTIIITISFVKKSIIQKAMSEKLMCSMKYFGRQKSKKKVLITCIKYKEPIRGNPTRHSIKNQEEFFVIIL